MKIAFKDRKGWHFRELSGMRYSANAIRESANKATRGMTTAFSLLHNRLERELKEQL